MSKHKKALKPLTKKQFYAMAAKQYERVAELDRGMPQWWKDVKLKNKLQAAIVRKILKLEELQVQLASADWKDISTEQLAELFDAAASSGIELSKTKPSPDDWVRVPRRLFFVSKTKVSDDCKKYPEKIRPAGTRGVYEIRRKYLIEYLEGDELKEYRNH